MESECFFYFFETVKSTHVCDDIGFEEYLGATNYMQLAIISTKKKGLNMSILHVFCVFGADVMVFDGQMETPMETACDVFFDVRRTYYIVLFVPSLDRRFQTGFKKMKRLDF